MQTRHREQQLFSRRALVLAFNPVMEFLQYGSPEGDNRGSEQCVPELTPKVETVEVGDDCVVVCAKREEGEVFLKSLYETCASTEVAPVAKVDAKERVSVDVESDLVKSSVESHGVGAAILSHKVVLESGLAVSNDVETGGTTELAFAKWKAERKARKRAKRLKANSSVAGGDVKDEKTGAAMSVPVRQSAFQYKQELLSVAEMIAEREASLEADFLSRCLNELAHAKQRELEDTSKDRNVVIRGLNDPSLEKADDTLKSVRDWLWKNFGYDGSHIVGA